MSIQIYNLQGDPYGLIDAVPYYMPSGHAGRIHRCDCRRRRPDFPAGLHDRRDSRSSCDCDKQDELDNGYGACDIQVCKERLHPLENCAFLRRLRFCRLDPWRKPGPSCQCPYLHALHDHRAPADCCLRAEDEELHRGKGTALLQEDDHSQHGHGSSDRRLRRFLRPGHRHIPAAPPDGSRPPFHP